MSKTRFTKWIVLACIGTVAACTSGDDGTAGNTELNVVIPNGFDNGSPDPNGNPQPSAVDIQTVEYTMNCLGNGDTFLDNAESFPDAVTLNGNLEVNEADPVEAPGINPSTADVFQGFMDLPPGNCSVELRARDADGEVICTDREGFTVVADTTAQVNLVLYCDLSFQAPVGMQDVAGTFSFNVGNFCPDLIVLNCLESLPQAPVDGAGAPTGDPATTTCEVRLRDGDQTCGTACDPQTCEADGLSGLVCTQPGGPVLPSGFDPGADPGTTTTVSCGGAAMDCDGLGGPDDTECTFVGDQLGTLAVNAGIVGNPATFDVNCGLSAAAAVITCTATTTDGDEDCDKTKVVTFTCPGLDPCDPAATPPPPDCDDNIQCTADSCDSSGGSAACVNTPVADGTACTDAPSTSGLGICQAGACIAQGCTVTGCPDDGNDCTDLQTCNAGTELCEPIPPANSVAGTPCSGGNGACDGAGTCIDNCTGVDCSDGNECSQDLCDPSTNPGTCSNPNEPDGTSCAGGTGQCSGGACAIPNNVCVQYAPIPVPSLTNCDGSPGNECICEKPEFIAVDCELLGNSAPIPLAASTQQFTVAFAGVPVPLLPQQAVVLPSALICGFIGAGFADATVANSFGEATYTNADLASTQLNSWLDDGTAGGAFVQPHLDVIFDFGTACGDNCTGTPLTCDDGTTPCTLGTFTTDCSVANGGGVGTGPGIVAPLLPNGPGTLPPGPSPVILTPSAAGSVDIDTPYTGVALNLPDVGGVASGYVGGSVNGVGNPLCAPLARGAENSPRVMYDAICDKPTFGVGGCQPFEDFTNTANVCKLVGLESGDLPDGVPPCCDNQLPCVAPCQFLPSDLFCVTQPNVDSCCAAISTDYPTAGPAQNPQLWVNP